MENLAVTRRKCINNVKSLYKDLVRTGKIRVYRFRLGSRPVELRVGRRRTIIYMDPLLSREELNSELIMDIIMSYRYRKTLGVLSTFLTSLGAILLGLLVSHLVTASTSVLNALSNIIALLVMAVSILVWLRIRRRGTREVRYIEAIDPICREAVDLLKGFLLQVWEQSQASISLQEQDRTKLGLKKRKTMIELDNNPIPRLVSQHPALQTLLKQTG